MESLGEFKLIGDCADTKLDETNTVIHISIHIQLYIIYIISHSLNKVLIRAVFGLKPAC